MAVEEGTEVEAALLSVLCSHAPSCLGGKMAACGQLHGCQAGDQRQLLLTAFNEDWKDAAGELCMGHKGAEDA